MPRRLALLVLLALLALPACVSPAAPPTRSAAVDPAARWFKLDTVPYKGKQDDIHFLDARTGLYANGAGKIYRSDDGGASWREVLSRPGTYFRAVGMVDDRFLLAGNLGPDYYPGVTDATPLYLSRDGGLSWQAAAAAEGPALKGICAIDILRPKDGGAPRVIHAGGRVGGPAQLMRSEDGGLTWRSRDLGEQAAMILDVKFLDADHGLVFAASSTELARSNALILRTEDGGANWKTVYRSTRPHEMIWKASFPTAAVGYATVQSYDPDPKRSQRVVVKTEDGGRSWRELPLVDNAAAREFGIGFATAEMGWVGTSAGGFETRDGGRSWKPVSLGRAVNKIRVLPEGEGFVAYAIGVDVYKFAAPK